MDGCSASTVLQTGTTINVIQARGTNLDCTKFFVPESHVNRGFMPVGYGIIGELLQAQVTPETVTLGQSDLV